MVSSTLLTMKKGEIPGVFGLIGIHGLAAVGLPSVKSGMSLYYAMLNTSESIGTIHDSPWPVDFESCLHFVPSNFLNGGYAACR
jgi:hypothetical protein